MTINIHMLIFIIFIATARLMHEYISVYKLIYIDTFTEFEIRFSFY